MALDGLLCARHGDVRTATGAFLERVRASPSGHAWLLRVLGGDRMALADRHPRHCGTFYRVFAEAVAATADMPCEVSHATHTVILPYPIHKHD